jgi:hypothetical protein
MTIVLLEKIWIICYFLNMEPCTKKKTLLLVPAVCISFSVFFSETLIGAYHDHDCIGEGCPVCLQIEAADIFLKAMKLAGICFLLTACFVFLAYSAKERAELNFCFLSLFGLKVRFNL